MTLSSENIFRLARMAFEEFPEERVVREELVRGLSDLEEWGEEECDLATRMLETGQEKQVSQMYLMKVPYGRNEEWDRIMQKAIRDHPKIAKQQPKWLKILAEVLAQEGRINEAIDTYEELRGCAKDPAQAQAFMLKILDLLPKVGDDTEFQTRVSGFMGSCLADPTLTTALKVLILQRRICVNEAVEIFGTWEALLRDASQAGEADIPGEIVIEDRRKLLKVYIDADDIDETRAVLRYCSRLENLPVGITVEETIDKVIGVFDEALMAFGSGHGLHLQRGDFCLSGRRFDEALKSYVSFREAGGGVKDVCDRLERLIEGVRNVGEMHFLRIYLQAYHELAALLLSQGRVDEADARLREVREHFFQISEEGSSHRLLEAEQLDTADQIRALRILSMKVLQEILADKTEDVGLLEDLGLLAYSLRVWELASDVYGRLIKLYLKMPGAAKRIQDLFHRQFWSYYCRGQVHRAGMLSAIDGFIWENRHTPGLQLDVLQEYCALGFHELALGDESVPEALARQYVRKATRYYEQVMRQPTAPADRPYLAELQNMFARKVRSESPFEYLKYKYRGSLSYDIPLEEEDIGPFAGDQEIEKIEPMATISGFGQVYRARRRVNGRFVDRAIKMLKKDIAREDMSSAEDDFQRECQIMRELDHPNIVKFFGAGRAEGRQYIEMEFVEGTDLERFINQKRQFTSMAARLKIFLKICAGVQYLHCFRQGIVHRDLHPRNVLLGGADGEIVKVADFGLARVLDDEGVAKSSRIMGRMHYVPPETQEPRREPFHIRGDVYSLGRILCFILTGRAMPDRQTIEEITGKTLAGICERSSSDEPDRRYASAAELAEAIKEASIDLSEVKAEDAKEVVEQVDNLYRDLQPAVTFRDLWNQYQPADESEATSLETRLQGRDFIQIDVTSPNGEPLSIKFINTVRRAGIGIIHRLTELQQIAAMDHANVERLLYWRELDTSPPCFYIVYNRIPGRSLFELIKVSERFEADTGRILLPASFALQVGLQMADALAEAHRHGVIHRMLSPAKVTVDMEGGQCVLTDFSAAVLKDQKEMGLTATMFGDEDYLAPEATGANPDPVNERTDLYGLGGTLVSLLLGTAKARLRPENVETLIVRHGLDDGKVRELVSPLIGVTRREQVRRTIVSAEAMKQALTVAAKTIELDLQNYDWKGIASEVSEYQP